MHGIIGLGPEIKTGQTQLEKIQDLDRILNILMSERTIINGFKKEQILGMTPFQKIEFLEDVVNHRYWRFTLTEQETLLIRSFLEKIDKYDFWGLGDRKIGEEPPEE